MSKRLQKVVSVTTSITTILWLSGVAAFAPMAALAATINEGDTIRVANTFDIYIAKYMGAKKFKRLILSPSVFNSYGHLSWSAVKTVTQSEMDAFTTSDLVRALGDQKVYKLTPVANSDNGAKQWLNMTAEAFTAGGYDWDSIYVINNTDRDVYTTGTEITGGTSVSPSTSASTPAGSLSVSLASDTPAAGVAVGGAARVPFTKVSFTAGATAATITGLTVQRTGLADDAALASIALIDNADNTQVGLNQTLNSAHQVTFTDTLTIPANTTKSYTLSANMLATAALEATYAGQVAALSLVSVTTAGTLSGVLPITGNGQTINGTLVIGAATVSAGSLDPGVANTGKSVGTTAFAFSSARVAAGAAEDVTLYSIRWNQSGSAAAGDLSNVVVSDGTTDYATTVSSDGKYYTASFGTAGIVIGKGLNKEFTVKANIVSGSGRTIAFDIYRNTDVVVKGNTYGYYMVPTFTDNGVTHATANATDVNNTTSPYFEGSHVTVAGGTLRVDKSTTGAPTANITRGATGQILGAFDFVVAGESVTVSSVKLDFDMTGTGSSTDVTSVTLSKADGTVLSTGGTSVVSTNVSATLDGVSNGYVNFSGAMTFPVGTTQVIVKGNLGTNFVAGDTFRVGFVLVPTNISSVTGGTTGNSISPTPATGILFGNIMTLKGGALTVTVSGTPVAQAVIAGSSDYIFANYLFDATASGEDVRVTSISLDPTLASTVGNSNSYFVYDGTTKLNSTAGVIVTQDTAVALTLDTPLVITKGTSKTITLKGNILATATTGDRLQWGIDNAAGSVIATGVSTGQAIVETNAGAVGQIMTIASSGQYSVALDASTPTGKLVAANTTGNIMTVLRFKATSEAINVTKINLALTSASSTGIDLSLVTIYDGTTLLGSGTFANASGSTSSLKSFTLTTPLALAANEEKVVTIKADIAVIATTNTVATAGHNIIINYDGSTAVANNVGTGMSSGAEIANYSVTTAQAAAYIYRSIPTVTKMEVSTTQLTNTTMDLFKFSVKADAKGDIDLYKFTFHIGTSVASVGSLTLVDVTPGTSEITLAASTTAAIQQGAGWASSATDIDVLLLASPGTWGGTATPRTVSADATKEFVLRGTVTGATTAATITTTLQGDAGMQQTIGAYTAAAATIDGWATDDDFIWSDWSKASHTIATLDWTNGYLVSGLPSSNTVSQTLSF